MGLILSFVTDLLGDLDLCLYSLVPLGSSYFIKSGLSAGQIYPVSDGLRSNSLNQPGTVIYWGEFPHALCYYPFPMLPKENNSIEMS